MTGREIHGRGGRGGRSGRGGRGGRPPVVPPIQEQEHEHEQEQEQGLEDIPMGHDDHGREQRRGRGSNRMWDTPSHPDARFEVVLAGKGFAEGKVTRQISKASKSLFKGPWPTWKKVDPMYRNQMWGVFESKFKWHTNIDGAVRKAWNDTMKKTFKDFMHDGREDAKRRYTECTGRQWDEENPNYSVLAPYHPENIDEKHWAILCNTVWNTPQWINKSKKAKKNRHTLVEGVISKHSGGSISMPQERYKLEKQGKQVSPFDLLVQRYTKKKKGESSGSNQEMVHPRMDTFKSAYQASMTQQHGEDASTHPPADPAAWTSAAGGVKKGHVFGVGDVGQMDYVLLGRDTSSMGQSFHCGSSSSGPSSSEELRNMQEKMRQLEEDNERLRREMEERQRRNQEEMESRMREIVAEMMRDGTLPFPPRAPRHPPAS